MVSQEAKSLRIRHIMNGGREDTLMTGRGTRRPIHVYAPPHAAWIRAQDVSEDVAERD
jgi:hypothetical protein